jgi:Flp pilus assembly protein TadG
MIRFGRRRGATVVLAAIFMGVLFGMVAFAIDIGYITQIRTELQRVADACALAAVEEMPNQYHAASVIDTFAADNFGAKGADFASQEVEFGRWDRDTATFTSPPPAGKRANAVRVTLGKTEAEGNSLNLFFSRVLGAATADVTASATAMYDFGLCGPFVGIEWLAIPGTPATDSYDSSEGPYSLAAAGDRASICSDGPITVSGGAMVNGDSMSGRGYDTALNGGAGVSGAIGERRRPLDLPPVDPHAAAISNNNDDLPQIYLGSSSHLTSPINNQGDLDLVAGEHVDFPPGTYYLRNLTLHGGSSIGISGETRIYLTGNLDTAGGLILNSSADPNNLKILMTGGTAKLTADSAFYGVLYAPNTDVTVGGSADLYGAIVGRTLSVNGSGNAHYDESLDLSEFDVPRRRSLVD